ncbi:MAG TPA: hypothetical protein VGS14_11030 [Actinomycetes bacterium]|nr:hypothetical protein [Actinomycetes bacterium]
MTAQTMTGGQAAFWRAWQKHDPDAPARFTPGRYVCPVGHPGGKRSLKVVYEGARVTGHCFEADCGWQQVIDRLGVRRQDLDDDGPARGGRLAGVYPYPDESGAEVLRVHRYEQPTSTRYQVWTGGEWRWDNRAGARLHLLYRLPHVLDAVQTGERVYLVDSEASADALFRAGAVATTIAGKPGAQLRTSHIEWLRDGYVTIVARRDQAGRDHARLAGAALREVAAEVEVVEPQANRPHATAADHLAAGFRLDDFAPLFVVEGSASASGVVEGQSEISGTVPPPSRRTLAEVETAFRAHHKHGDLVAFRATLACYAANMHLDADPVWLGLVSGSSTGKTETAMALAACPNVSVESTLSGEAALLSGTPEKDRSAGATGGLLRQIGERGFAVLKDFTTILSMHPDKRGAILSALREVYDGSWSRAVGTGGGHRLEWKGKLGLVMCSTTAYDRAHAAIAVMGDRFLLVRLDDDEREAGTRAALVAASDTRAARAAIAQAAAGLLGHAPATPALDPAPADVDRLAKLADFVTLARSPVARDYKGEIDLVLDPEGPYRFAKQLHALWRACGLLGLGRAAAWEVANRVARDSMPRLRWRVLDALAVAGQQSTNTLARAALHPSRSVKRALEDLTAHRVVERIPAAGPGLPDHWRLAADRRITAVWLAEATVPEISDPPQEAPHE